MASDTQQPDASPVTHTGAVRAFPFLERWLMVDVDVVRCQHVGLCAATVGPHVWATREGGTAGRDDAETSHTTLQPRAEDVTPIAGVTPLGGRGALVVGAPA